MDRLRRWPYTDRTHFVCQRTPCPDAACDRRRVRPRLSILIEPRGGRHLPFVFNSPHAGASIPPSFLAASRLDALALRRSEDAFVDELFAPSPDLGARCWRRAFPRAYLDVNREPYELDPRMFDGRLPPFANTRSHARRRRARHDRRASSPTGRRSIAGACRVDEALRRIEWLYKPYHRDAAPAGAPHARDASARQS